MLDSGSHLWNSGIFLFKANTIIAAFEKHANDIFTIVNLALHQAKTDIGFLRLDAQNWSKVEPISIDYAVMEHASNLSVVKFDGAWTDLGGWDAVALEMGADEDGNSISGNVTAIDCKGSVLRSESVDLELVGIGLKDVIAIAMEDAVLVINRSRSQDVKKAVEFLNAKGAKQAEAFPIDHRPWGWFETLALAPRFQVKRIVVKPGAALSLQSHVHRSEHWIVVEGTARVTIDGEVRLVSENQSVYIPLGAKHRMETQENFRWC